MINPHLFLTSAKKQQKRLKNRLYYNNYLGTIKIIYLKTSKILSTTQSKIVNRNASKTS